MFREKLFRGKKGPADTRLTPAGEGEGRKDARTNEDVKHSSQAVKNSLMASATKGSNV